MLFLDYFNQSDLLVHLNIETNILVSLVNILRVKKRHRKNKIYHKCKLDIHVYFILKMEKTEK
jgi:hypothetical protein